LTSTITSTFYVGQPIPVASIETWNVTVGRSPDMMALNPKTDAVYIADLFSRNVTIVYAPLHSVMARIVLPSRPTWIAVDDSTNMVYASVSGGIEEINGSTNQVVGELPLDFARLAVDTATHVLWGTQMLDVVRGTPQNGSLVAVDLRTGSVVANISFGHPVNSVAVNSETDMVYSAGCLDSFTCESELALVNGTSATLVTTVKLGTYDYPELAVNPATNVVYVSGDPATLVALNGTNGNVIFRVNPLVCGGISNMVVVPYLNEVAAAANNNFTLVYDGATGKLLNMYSISNGHRSGPLSVAFNPQSDELYIGVSGEFSQLVAFPNAASTGSVDSALMDQGEGCLPP
jgi:DNA-binding beta-propeller fold protein YncE